MVIVGLTGSIGMGKTTAARMLRCMGVPVYDSDAVVHRMLGPGGAAVAAVAKAFPATVRDGEVDRQALGERVFSEPAALRTLESIIHPRVRCEERSFLKRAALRRVPLVVLDIPLLFETGGDARCDATVVVSAPAFLQRQRVLSRSGMTEDKFEAVLARQMTDAEKRRRADFVVPTGLGRSVTFAALQDIVRRLRFRRGTRWPPPPYPGDRKIDAPNHP